MKFHLNFYQEHPYIAIVSSFALFDIMAFLPFAYFPLFIVSIRLRTLRKRAANGDFDNVKTLLEETMRQMETLPCDYDDMTKLKLLEHMEMAEVLLELGAYGEVEPCLKQAKRVCQEFAMGVSFSQKALVSNDKDYLGVLDILPFDVREVIKGKIV